jgi:ABC-type Na+ efflux pump permease subunit
MRGNKMGYFWGLFKKEYIEMRYSWKQVLMYGFMFVFFIWIANASENYTTLHAISWNNALYFLTVFISSFMPGNFLMESILSDKRNQVFERYFVSGNIKTIMLAKLSAMSVLGIIPFFIFYTYLRFNGINIIDNIFMAINTPLYFWIGLCIMTIICFLLNDEKSIGCAGILSFIPLVGLLYLNDFLGAKYNPLITVITTMICAVIVTFIAYKIYKKTKYFLKI